MTEPVRRLLGDCPVMTGCTVSRLVRDNGGWALSDGEGRRLPGLYDSVLVTAPAPQAKALAGSDGAGWSEVDAAVEHVRYAPCWTLMLAHGGDPVFPQTHRRERDPAAAVAWIARDATKPGRGADRETLVVQASPAWSREHLEEERPAVAERLMAELRRVPGLSLPSPERIGEPHAHRWRYAMVERALDEPCLWSPDLRLGIAGDGCLGGRVEAAYLSGRALARRVLADSDPAPGA